MTPNELRIGCCVKLKDSGEIVRVERLSRRKVGFFHGNDKSRGYFRKYSEIEGVLIHPDQAESSDLFNSILDNNPHVTAVFHESNTLRMRMDFADVECGIKVPDYLHELQNLHYALTGEELKIEL